jgi:Ca2+-transporting ATPase
MRDLKAPLWSNDVVRNPYVWAALAICVGLLAAAVLVPPFASILAVTRLDASGWLLVLIAGSAPVIAVEIGRVLGWHTNQELPDLR